MVGIESFAAVVGLGQGPAEEVPPIHRVPCLPDELVVHFDAVALGVFPDSGDLIVRQRVLVVLGEEQ